jgi:excisionase family DNA binding protein
MTSTTRGSYESLAQASERTSISSQTLRRRIASGELAAYRTGRLIRVNPDDVDRLLVRIPTARLWPAEK